MKLRLLILLATVVLAGNAHAERPLTSQEKSALIGVHQEFYPYPSSSSLVWVCQIALDLTATGELVGHRRCERKNWDTRIYLNYYQNFKRLTPQDWHKTRIISLDGRRCDKDRICLSSEVWELPMKHWGQSYPTLEEGYWETLRLGGDTLWQFSLDFEESERYVSMRLDSPTKKITNYNGPKWWITESDGAPSSPTPRPQPDGRLISTGTGFIANPNYVVTADHVLRSNDQGDVCRKISIIHGDEEYEAKIITGDPTNDLGLIKLAEPIDQTAKLRDGPDLAVGEAAINYGYPLTGTLSTSAKLNSGTVSSLAGFQNNSAMFQYDAATQHGNSGGPVMDASGNIIGIVRSGLDNAETQLVNFAVKSTIIEGFLKANKVPFEKADLTEELKLPDIAEKAEAFTVLVGCWE